MASAEQGVPKRRLCKSQTCAGSWEVVSRTRSGAAGLHRAVLVRECALLPQALFLA